MTPRLRWLHLLLLVTALATPAFGQDGYTNFETVPVRPLALSADGNRLFAVNTPDARLEIFDVTSSGIEHQGSVAVGLDPVAVAVRTPEEVWVVNHLSDSVSIVDVGSEPPRVTRTLLVGDEPWDVVFAGRRESKGAPYPRAFVSAARRGQNHPETSLEEMKQPSLGWADVWVFDADDPGEGLGGTPETIVRLFGDKPRPLAVSPDRTKVYVGIFHSGNQTTTINPGAVCDGGSTRGPCTVFTSGIDDPPAMGEVGTGDPPVLPGGTPGPDTDAEGNPNDENGLIVRFDPENGEFRDELGRNWNGAVPFDLPDLDVFAIDATANPPVETASFASVGTILFNMAVDPRGRVWVTNTEAPNEVRFEGSGTRGTTVRGHLHEARITVIDPRDGSVAPRHLNKHIDYDVHPAPADVREKSLATPHEVAFSPDGKWAYVAAFGSRKLGVFKTRQIRHDSFRPRAKSHIPLSDGGPTGIVVHPWRRQLYAYTRFSNRISVINTFKRKEVASVALHNPEPDLIPLGRPFFYDATFSSSNGEASCSACHVHGDKDDLAWDLGNPDAVLELNNNPFFVGAKEDFPFHPLKGPMLTQTFRGMQNHGPMHWRGDRSGALAPGGSEEDGLDENEAFLAFNGAFDSLLGREGGTISDEQMQAFASFALSIFPPPNPNRPLDNLDVGTAVEGRRTFFDEATNPAPITECNSCHVLDPSQGFFGTAGLSVPDPRGLKVPHLRNLYDRVGAFGLVALNTLQPDGSSRFGPQVRGYGLSHNGSLGDLNTFLVLGGFIFPDGDPQRRAVHDFMLTFPSNMAPVVGQQVTVTDLGDTAADQRILLFRAQAGTPWVIPGNQGEASCDLVVRGLLDGESRGFLYDPVTRRFESDRRAEAPMGQGALRTRAALQDQPLTFTCAPPGSGVRMALDRDGDGEYDGDETDAGTDPADPESF